MPLKQKRFVDPVGSTRAILPNVSTKEARLNELISAPGFSYGTLPLSAVDRLRPAIESRSAQFRSIQDTYRSQKFNVTLRRPEYPHMGNLQFWEEIPGTASRIIVKLDTFSRAAPVDIAWCLLTSEANRRSRWRNAVTVPLFSGSLDGHPVSLFHVFMPGPFIDFANLVMNTVEQVGDDSFLVLSSGIDLGPEVPQPSFSGLVLPSVFVAFLIRPQLYQSPDGSISLGSVVSIFAEASQEHFPTLADMIPPEDWALTLVRTAERGLVAYVQAATNLSRGLPSHFIVGLWDTASGLPITYPDGVAGPLTAAQEFYRLDHCALTSMLSSLSMVMRSNKDMESKLLQLKQGPKGPGRGRRKKVRRKDRPLPSRCPPILPKSLHIQQPQTIATPTLYTPVGPSFFAPYTLRQP